MESKAANRSGKRSYHPTILGEIIFTLLMLLLLSLAAWLFLIILFTTENYIKVDYNVTAHIRVIVVQQLKNMPTFFMPSVLKTLQKIEHFRILGSVYFPVSKFIDIVIGVTEIVMIRLSLFVGSIPTISIVLFISVTDGLVQRDIRKFRAARESAFFFHRVKPLASISLYCVFLTYMAMPWPVRSELFALSMAVSTGIFTMLSIKSFKKYM